MAHHLTSESFTLYVLHYDKWTITFVIYFVNGADVRVVEHSCGPCLPEQPRPGSVVLDQFSGEHFNGYVALEGEVVREEHFAHTARPELFENSVMRELF